MEFVRVSRDMGLELEMLPPDKNIALGEVAKNDFGQRVPPYGWGHFTRSQ